MSGNGSPRRRLRFLQFSLGQLLVLIAVLSVLLGILTPRLHEALRQRRAIEDLQRWETNHADLERAVQTNDLALARQALEAGADPNHARDNRPMLHRAIAAGHVAMVEALLDFGADANRSATLQPAKLVRNGPPVYAAVCSNQPVEVRVEMLRLLIKHGADIRSEVADQNMMDVAVWDSNARLADALREFGLPYGPREMAAFGRLDELRRVVAENPGVLCQRFRPVGPARPGQEPTLLGMALSKGHREVALFLIDSGAPLDTVESLGSTLLHQAARGGDPELIRVLVARGLDVNARDEYGDTPLHDGAWRDKPELVAALVAAGADVNARGGFQGTPLHLAVRHQRVEIVRMLLEAGADPTIPDRTGQTALDVAQKTSPEMLKLLEDASRRKRSGHASAASVRAK